MKRKTKKRTLRVLSLILCFLFFLLLIIPALTGCAKVRVAYNEWRHEIKKVDDATRYETRKKVEDTCRATIVSYESDRLTWLQYKDSDSSEQRSWADAAKLRANKAAIQYNEYFLKNSYVFEDNVPADIRTELPILQ